ncbi:Methylphosphotriester-DNA--protein-cysteine S-methyltransferase (EC 2.1.1.n11) / DNA-3-methyladenine glycosylase II [hydrothermal vent metagenome]|uniref:Methylphosphotriester-DNA--protein-cysteine S-methyltransferase / DNA-3-methyladenine glycosylase II n=1 Tax=hydrothermal vent metagenome TaxID=652676 RepID=A0A3B0TXP8_9ZZZZ
MRRDAAYDGVFFVTVKTTHIYCRPICPAKQPKTENVNFYASAAACEQAGFRPCLRCRPESAPFSAAWNGTKTTVERALRLINKGDLDAMELENFAARLGIGARHLTRLFQTHLGTTPGQVAKTARVQRAKRLLDETDLSISEIANKAGFKSLRRFNAVFKETYRRAPSAIKRRALIVKQS